MDKRVRCFSPLLFTITSMINNKNYVGCLNQNKIKVRIDKDRGLINEFGTFLHGREDL